MRLRAILLAASVALFAAWAPPALAGQGIETFETTMSTSEAGGHPDLRTVIELEDAGQPEAAKNIVINLPEGVFGNPNAVTRCNAAQFALFSCPADSQAGLMTVRANYKGDEDFLLGTAPIFSQVPEGENETARFSYVVPTLNLPLTIPVNVRTGDDYGLRFTVSGPTQLAPLAAADLTVWGFPAATEHLADRFPQGTPAAPSGCPGEADASCNANFTASTLPVNPLTINPSVCSGEPLEVELAVQTYQDPSNLTRATSHYPAITDCPKQVFRPVMRARPTTTETDAPSGLDLELTTEQFLGLAASPAQIKDAVVRMPEGLTINPDAADGQTACPDAAANFGTELPANCPDSSKIGSFSMETPALAGPLHGSMYFGEPQPGDTYRLIMAADGFGIHAKLVGSVVPDPRTGRLTAHFSDLPQVPFENFSVHLFASQRALLATPTHCTIYTVDSTFTPWNGTLSPQSSPSSFSLQTGPNGKPCPGEIRPFSPRLAAGTSVATAGVHSDFFLKLDRDDGDQYLGDLNFTMPPGLTASLRGITYCPEPAIAAAATRLGREEQVAPSCPSTSAIGTSNVAAGPGTHPFHAVGKMYMAGPFKGAPLSLVAITPALAGPYDYGVVVVRVAVQVDQTDAHVIAVSDTVPSIIGGVPLRMRSIRVSIDRPNFMINPTNCSPFAINSQGIGDQGSVVGFLSPFQAVNCTTLPFKPRMAVRQLGGKGKTARTKNAALQFDLRTRPGDANIQSMSVTLPKAFAIDQRHLGNLCSEKELAAKRCAGRQPIGRVKTSTPLLDQPLTGLAYAVSGAGGLPRLAFILDGQVTLVPRAETVTDREGRLKTTVPIVPDAPVGHFTLTMFGGKVGYLTNTRSLCAQRPVVKVTMHGQNGKTSTLRSKVKTACGKKRR